VSGQSDTVPRSMDKLGSIPRFGNDCTGGSIHRLTADTRFCGFTRSPMRPADNVVDRSCAGISGFAEGNGPGDVRGVAIRETADVDDNDVTALQLAAARVMMGKGGVRAKADKRRE